MIRFAIILLILLSSFAQANEDYRIPLNQFIKACTDETYSTCKSKLKGTPENQQLLMDTLKLMVLNKRFSDLYSSTYGSKAFQEFNGAFKLSTSYVNFSDFTLKSMSNERFILKDSEGNMLDFGNTKQGWKLNVDNSLSGFVVAEAKQLIELSIGAYLSLNSKIKPSTSVDDVFKLGGRYFTVVIYNYSNLETQQKLDKIFQEKNIDAEKLKQEMFSFYQQQAQ
jgi:hypothetical protein